MRTSPADTAPKVTPYGQTMAMLQGDHVALAGGGEDGANEPVPQLTVAEVKQQLATLGFEPHQVPDSLVAAFLAEGGMLADTADAVPSAPGLGHQGQAAPSSAAPSRSQPRNQEPGNHQQQQQQQQQQPVSQRDMDEDFDTWRPLPAVSPGGVVIATTPPRALVAATAAGSKAHNPRHNDLLIPRWPPAAAPAASATSAAPASTTTASHTFGAPHAHHAGTDWRGATTTTTTATATVGQFTAMQQQHPQQPGDSTRNRTPTHGRARPTAVAMAWSPPAPPLSRPSTGAGADPGAGAGAGAGGSAATTAAPPPPPPAHLDGAPSYSRATARPRTAPFSTTSARQGTHPRHPTGSGGATKLATAPAPPPAPAGRRGVTTARRRPRTAQARVVRGSMVRRAATRAKQRKQEAKRRPTQQQGTAKTPGKRGGGAKAVGGGWRGSKAKARRRNNKKRQQVQDGRGGGRVRVRGRAGFGVDAADEEVTAVDLLPSFGVAGAELEGVEVVFAEDVVPPNASAGQGVDRHRGGVAGVPGGAEQPQQQRQHQHQHQQQEQPHQEQQATPTPALREEQLRNLQELERRHEQLKQQVEARRLQVAHAEAAQSRAVSQSQAQAQAQAPAQAQAGPDATPGGTIRLRRRRTRLDHDGGSHSMDGGDIAAVYEEEEEDEEEGEEASAGAEYDDGEYVFGAEYDDPVSPRSPPRSRRLPAHRMKHMSPGCTFALVCGGVCFWVFRLCFCFLRGGLPWFVVVRCRVVDIWLARCCVVVCPARTDIHARIGYGRIRHKSDPVSKFAAMQRKWDSVRVLLRRAPLPHRRICPHSPPPGLLSSLCMLCCAASRYGDEWMDVWMGGWVDCNARVQDKRRAQQRRRRVHGHMTSPEGPVRCVFRVTLLSSLCRRPRCCCFFCGFVCGCVCLLVCSCP